jgi:hypothetical protein
MQMLDRRRAPSARSLKPEHEPEEARPMSKAPTPGAAWAADVRARYDLNASDELTVDLIADTVDAIADLPATAISEKRQQRVVLLRALSQLALPDDDGNVAPTLTASQRGRKAARARWDAQREAS